ncbi:LysR family transcriptional regulator [Rhizorhabdus argentea]|uniref:LysR family transcriptional regulator n=1 Tax=Rhizorhabdus argentea TaxID=1387174 RepID=UPI0030EE291E
MLESDQLRAFLAIVRTGNMLAAARRLGLDHSTVSRRLSALEQALGARLFDRSPRGLAPTGAAVALVPHAEQVESALITAAASVAGRDDEVSGTVRLATPEIFGTCLVAPHIAELSALHPHLTLELAPESRSISLSKREADIAVTLRPPPRGRLIARKLTDYRLGVYGSRAYLDEHGPIGGSAAIGRHGFVSYIDELLDYPEINALDQVALGAPIVFRSSSSAAQQAAVAAGIGLGVLHRLAAESDTRLVRVLADEIVAIRSYWLVLHADLQKTPRIRAVVDFLGQLTERLQPKL